MSIDFVYHTLLYVLNNCCDDLRFSFVTMDWNDIIIIAIICKMADTMTKEVRAPGTGLIV